jgi:hypothetical protein
MVICHWLLVWGIVLLTNQGSQVIKGSTKVARSVVCKCVGVCVHIPGGFFCGCRKQNARLIEMLHQPAKQVNHLSTSVNVNFVD